MSLNQDQQIALWLERGEVLGELLEKLRNGAVVISADSAHNTDLTFGQESKRTAGLTEQPA